MNFQNFRLGLCNSEDLERKVRVESYKDVDTRLVD